jgi:hypothetical protein
VAFLTGSTEKGATVFDALLELFERKSPKEKEHPRHVERGVSGRQGDDSAFRDDDDDHRGSHDKPSKRRQFADLLDMD